MSSSTEQDVEVGPAEGSAEGVPRSHTTSATEVTTPQGPIRLAMAADDSFAMPMAVTLFSALRHLSSDREVQVLALDAGLSSQSKERVGTVARRAHSEVHLHWTKPDTSNIDRVDLEMDPRFSPAIFYRLLIPEVLPETVDRILYLDSDLIFERSLRPLWEKSFQGTALQAVPERIVSCPKAGIADWERLGLDPGTPFFNSGLMLMNLNVWREEDIHGQTIRYLRNPENDFCYAGDQEALNAVLAGRWRPLDQRWNAIDQVFDPDLRQHHEEMLGTRLESAKREPFVVHFTSDEKPWQPGCTHPVRHRFYHYLRESGWFTEAEYLRWRAQLSGKSVVQWLKDVSRPYRHKIGLRQPS